MNLKQIIDALPQDVSAILFQRLNELNVHSVSAHDIKKLVAGVEAEFGYLPEEEKTNVFLLLAKLPPIIMEELKSFQMD